MFSKRYLLIASLALPVLFYNNCGQQMQSAIDQASYQDLGQQAPDEREPEAVEPKVIETTYEPILADRFYLKSLLEDVFGPTAMSTGGNYPDRQVQANGSPCSLYAGYNVYDSRSKTWNIADAAEACSASSPDLTAASVNPKATVTRQALLAQTCSDLITTNDTFTYALKKIQPLGVPAKSKANVLKVYRLFYRNMPDPHQGLIDSLLVMLPESKISRDDWRVVFNAVCLSGHWQVL